MRARLSEGYKPQFDIDLRYGRKGEELVLNFLTGMLTDEPGHLTVEVKTDARALDTQNVYIEYECRRQDGWQPSGIAVSEADYWAVVIGETVVIGVPTAIIQTCCTKALAADPRYGLRREERDGSHPTRGVAIPVQLFWTWVTMELRHRIKAA